MTNTKSLASAAVALAEKYQVPLDTVEQLFRAEIEDLTQKARVTTYVSIFATRRVEAQLMRAQSLTSSTMSRAA